MSWWQQTSIYQIYPLSFYDSNNDGIGDIQGIIQKLDYIQGLGFETIWVSPFYLTELADFGYDICDYREVDPRFGTMADAQHLIDEVHKRGMKIIFDMVMNHTSDKHSWFLESRSSKDNPKRDWYIWHSGKNGKKPNNWISMTGTPGWNYDNTTEEYYYASFLPFQPDLNYRNPELKKEMLDTVRFWLNKGADGFRLDIFNCIIKDEKLRDNPFTPRYIPTMDNPNGFFQEKKFNMNLPENFAFAQELRKTVDEFSDPLLLGEVSGDAHLIKQFLGDNDGLKLIFLFETMTTPFTLSAFKRMITNIEKEYPAPLTPVYVFSNHDRMRYFSKLGKDVRKAKLLALIQMTLRGVPVVYNGEEIGMGDSSIPAHGAKDPLAKPYRFIPKFLTDMLDVYVNRDNCRTPMQWSDAPNAGFSKADRTWLPLNPEYASINVESQIHDSNSLLQCYSRLLELRNATPALKSGSLELIDENKALLQYTRTSESGKYLISCNFTSKKIQLKNFGTKLIFSTATSKSALDVLLPFEGKIYSLQ